MDTQSSKGDGRGETEHAANNASPQSPVGNEQSVNREASAQPSQNKESEGLPRKWEIGIGAFLAAVNFVALFIYLYQLIEMRKATEAATAGLALTREMARLDQRAWVAMTGVEGRPKVGEVLVIKTSCKNTGKTFARKLNVVIGIQGMPVGSEPDFKEFFSTAIEKHKTKGSVTLLPPNSEYGTRTKAHLAEASEPANPPITQEDLANITEGRRTVFVFGILTYQDIFNCEHWTTFCWQMMPSLEFRTYTKHNEADENPCP